MRGLPSGWVSTPLETIATWGSGGTPSRSESSFYGGGIPWIKSGELGPREITTTEESISEVGLANSSAKPFPAGSVAIAMYGATIGKTSILGIPATTNQACAVGIPLQEATSKEYLYYFLCSQKDAFIEAGKGGAQPNISQAVIKAWHIPLAPLPEQKRIADKLDIMMARIDACRDRLDRIPTILKRFQQTVLASATSGRLTEDWRAGDMSGWRYERAVDVCAKVQSGGTPREGFTDSGIPFLKVYNIVDQNISFEYRPQYIDIAIHAGSMSKSQVLPGDVLMNIVGPPLGKVAIVPDSYPAWNINQAITLFRPNERITSGWLYCILCGGENISEIIHETKGSAGQTNISLSQCRNFVFPIPPIKEQREIVRRVETLFAFANRLEARYAAARKQVEQLTPALLAKAFRGELVPQDPADEPASELLKRIAGSKEGMRASKRSKRVTPSPPLPSP